jgi:MGT family glycosyltransferase
VKIILASNPFMGHLNPLLAIGRILIAEGHQVAGLTATIMRKRIEAIGATFYPFPGRADQDLSDLTAIYPEFGLMPPGLEKARFSVERLFIDMIPGQYEGLMQVLSEFPADLIIAENLFMGALPMLLGPRAKRPPIILCGTTYLFWHRNDGVPILGGFPMAAENARREQFEAASEEFEAVFMEPANRSANECLRGMGCGPLPTNIFDSLVTLPDAYLQLTTQNFEFPRADLPDSVRFIGPLPIMAKQAPLPPWADELDGSRKVVLVTQGTVANYDFSHLVAPALAALADDPELLVVVTTGGRPTDAVPGRIPANARLASYLPFEWLLPKIDVFVTNGGYGSVNQALSFGVPLVTAGMTEDKADVNARVAWSGVGINLETNEPTAEALRRAVRIVLGDPEYQRRASHIANEMRQIDTKSKFLQIVDEVSRPTAETRFPLGMTGRGAFADRHRATFSRDKSIVQLR